MESVQSLRHNTERFFRELPLSSRQGRALFFRLTVLQYCAENIPGEEAFPLTAPELSQAIARVEARFGRIFDPFPLDDLPPSFFGEGGTLSLFAEQFPPAVFRGVPELVGRLYQQSLVPEREEIFRSLNQGGKIDRETLPPATQLFTPDWLIRYLCDSALATLAQGDPTLSPAILEELLGADRYLLHRPRKEGAEKPLSECRFFDPCMGGGHILSYLLVRLSRVYIAGGARPKDAVRLALEKNLVGGELDPAAAAVAQFTLLARAELIAPGILEEGLRPNILLFSPISAEEEEDTLPATPHGDQARAFLRRAGQLGSLCIPTGEEQALPDTLPGADLLRQWVAGLSGGYDALLTNPPYMGRKGMSQTLRNRLATDFPEGKSELYAAFILRCISLTRPGGVIGMLTLHTFLCLPSFGGLRQKLLEETELLSLLHSGAATFPELSSFNALAAAFLLRKGKSDRPSPAVFCRLTHLLSPEEKAAGFFREENRFLCNPETFRAFPGCPFLYDCADGIRDAFLTFPPLRETAQPRQGIATGDNSRFVRMWHEVPFFRIKRDAASLSEASRSGAKWFPYNKGGDFCRWYGQNRYVIAFDDSSREALAAQGNHLPSRSLYFRPGITWSLFGFENFAVRWKDAGFLFDVSGSTLLPPEGMEMVLLAFLGSNVAFALLRTLSPTVNFQNGEIGSLPLKLPQGKEAEEISAMAGECVSIAREVWDESELSWDFCRHPLL